MKRSAIVGIVALLLCVAVARAQTPGDFAYRLPLDAAGDGAFFRVDLPASVHEGAVRPDLADLRVFNADGAAVAFAFMPRPAAAREAVPSIALPLFPLRVDAARRELGDVAITVRKSATDTRIDLSTRDGVSIPAERVAGYLVDASDSKEPLAALAVALPAGANVNARARVEASDDLSSWRTLVSGAPLVDVEYAGRRLTRDRIELPRTKAKYLRITFEPGQSVPEIATLRGEFAASVIEAPRQWRTVKGVADRDRAGDYEFDLGGTFPADRAALVLPEVNTVVPAQIFVRATTKDEWRPIASTVFYRLRQDGGEATNPPVALHANDRHWKVRIDPKSGGLGNDPPELSIGWYPRTLVFAARGNGPFEVAYGSATAKAAALPIETLVPGYDALRTPPTFKIAMAGESKAPITTAPLREPIDVKRWVLWATLGLATVVLGWMAYALSRQMRRSAPAQPPESTPPDVAATRDNPG